MTKNLVTEISGEIFLHRHVWRVVERQLEHAHANPTGSFYDHLVVMVFAFNTLEGYLNYVGSHLAPTLWEDERNEKSIRSFSGKAAKVFDLCEIPEPDKAVRPYKTIWELQVLRDKIAHPKPIPFRKKFHYTEEELAPSPNYIPPLDELISLENVLTTVHDVQELIAVIHAAASMKIDDVWFGEEGLGGPLSHATGYTTIAPEFTAGDRDVKPDTDIVVHVETPKGPQAAGTILPFDDQPPDDGSEGNLGGIHVKFARKFGKVISVQVKTYEDAKNLVTALGRK
jgi:hypothetical protein